MNDTRFIRDAKQIEYVLRCFQLSTGDRVGYFEWLISMWRSICPADKKMLMANFAHDNLKKGMICLAIHDYADKRNEKIWGDD